MIDRIDYLLSDRDFATDFADLLRKYLGRRRTDVICGFPGLGKSSAAGRYIADLDSADFMGPNRWEDYERAIKEQIGKVNYILVSCHPETRAILKNLGIHYYIAYPSRELKEEYLERYRKRGDSIEFTNLLSNNFDHFINSIESDDYEDCTKIRIVKPGRYVKDVIDVISKLKSENSNYDPSWFMIS